MHRHPPDFQTRQHAYQHPADAAEYRSKKGSNVNNNGPILPYSLKNRGPTEKMTKTKYPIAAMHAVAAVAKTTIFTLFRVHGGSL